MPKISDLLKEWRTTRETMIALSDISMVPATEEERKENRRFISETYASSCSALVKSLAKKMEM